MLAELGPKRISLDKHSCFTDRTHRSANAFKFGPRGRSREEALPRGDLAPPRDRSDPVTAENSSHSLVRDLMAEIGQRSESIL